MIFDAVEVAYTVVNTNFATDFAALATAKSIANLGTVAIVKRQKAEMFLTLGITLPAIGVYASRARTQAKNQTQRDNLCTCVFDFYARDADPVKLAKQTELAAEALLMSVDRLAGAGSGVYAGAAEDESITIEVTDGYDKTIEPNYDRRAIVTFPLYDRDTGL